MRETRITHTAVTLAAALTLATTASHAAAAGPRDYMVIDLSGGPDAKTYPVSYESEPPDLDFDTCRKNELWLRLVQAGKFMMGSPANELGRENNEDLHQVTLTQPFYIGVFQVTQKQYELVMGTKPSGLKDDTQPPTVSYEILRGKSAGAQWPANNDVDADSFFGKLRAKTSLVADLPTEAQWEYACRAGTTTALNSGKNLTDRETCPNAAEVGRYFGNRDDGKGNTSNQTKVGLYKPNAWGLYDMHGNVFEWCLDWYQDHLGTAAVIDPKGSESGEQRVLRGGYVHWGGAKGIRSAVRNGHASNGRVDKGWGIRIVINLDSAPKAAPVATASLLSAEDEQLATTCAEFKTVWDSYKEGVEKINAEFQPKFENVNQQYQKSLEALRTAVRGKGDLEKTTAVTAELERFTKEKTIPPTPDDKAIAEIKALQTNAAKPFTALEKDMLTRLGTLTQRYGQMLEQVQAGLVRADKLDDAKAVSEARKRAKQTADDLAAQLAARNPPPARPKR